MISNVYFKNKYHSGKQQSLVEKLIVEATKIHGDDYYYCPRTIVNKDKLYEQDDQSAYNAAYLTEMYIDNVLGFQGDGQFLSKFAGVEIRDQIIMTIPKLTFENNVKSLNGQLRPNEGDIIFAPFDNRAFIIRYVDKYSVMYQLGKVYQWRLTCELFEASGQTFNTGIAEIDRLQKEGSLNIYDYAVLDTDGKVITLEDGSVWMVDGYALSNIDPLADNDDVQVEGANTIVDFSEIDPFIDGGEINKFL